MLDEIRNALEQTHPADRHTIKRYIAWVRFRRQMYNEFYQFAHWVNHPVPLPLGEGRTVMKAHWL